MIEDKKKGIKIAENSKEALLQRAYDSTKQRIEQEELTVEIDKVVLDYLKERLSKRNI